MNGRTRKVFLLSWESRTAFRLLFLIFVFAAFPVQAEPRMPQCCFKDVCFSVEIVDTPEARENGLMFRSGLAQDHGMFFVFPRPDMYALWMKNMRFPIDVVWFNEEKRVIEAFSDVPVCEAEPCPIYYSPENALYVLEIPAGSMARYGLKIGDAAKLKERTLAVKNGDFL